MNILVDIGNTRLKWCVDASGKMTRATAIDYKNATAIARIKQQWLGLEQPQMLAIASVSSKQREQQLTAIARELWPEINVLLAQTTAHDFGVHNGYHQAQQLGVDRWLNLIALHHFYPGNSCVIDCGSAITIDCMDAKGVHLGGLISPGIQLMQHALYQGTHDLSASRETVPPALSRSTAAAIHSGTLLAAAGLIDKMSTTLGALETRIITGGDAALLAPLLTTSCIIDADFVLKGLSLYCGKKPNG